MQRYKVATAEGLEISRFRDAKLWPVNNGEWVHYSDAVVEIRDAVAREREEIVWELETWLNDPGDIRPIRQVIKNIRAHGEKKGTPTCFTCGAPADEESLAKYRAMEKGRGPRKIEPLPYAVVGGTMRDKINEIADAVNELRKA